VGEDGRLYLTAKSEHYHIPLGHGFPGYQLLDRARTLGIMNATHNNTRGYITRLCERELIRAVNGLDKSDAGGLADILESRRPHVLNRVINLETGSIACEAGIKMMLARFYKIEKTSAAPGYAGKIPVFFVIGDYEGGSAANYHGTSVIAQTLRGLWPEFYQKCEASELYKVCAVNINDIEDFKAKFEVYQQGPYKVAGFIHEIILMNYGAIRLRQEYLREVYALCHQNDTPVMCDEIQSGMWYEGLFLFRKYGLNPDFVVVGKGFPGGQYPASKIILTAEMDNLNQFGALVTNGQEELASLAYLITMEHARLARSSIGSINAYFNEKMQQLKIKHPKVITYIEGEGLLSAITFHDVEKTVIFVRRLNEMCIDISAQVYKSYCPPAALLKLPVIASTKLIDWLVRKMDEVLLEIG
jgi:acetylornithine/succinyldiaminopimelate/putrescine aminotransferase